MQGPAAFIQDIEAISREDFWAMWQGETSAVEKVAILEPDRQGEQPLNGAITLCFGEFEGHTVGEWYVYNAYGKRTVMDASFAVRSVAQVDQRFGYTGRELDDESGLMQFRARYYSTEMGRFIGRDPIGYHDGMNLYAGWFVPGGIDPSGLSRRGGRSGSDRDFNRESCCNGVSYSPATQCCVNGEIRDRLEGGSIFSGMTVRRYAGGMGHQFIHGANGNNVGFYSQSGSAFGPGHYVNESQMSANTPGRPSPDNANYYYEWNLKIKDTDECTCKSISEIEQGLNDSIRNTNRNQTNFNIALNNCRQQSGSDLASNCLEIGDLIHSPPGAPSDAVRRATNDVRGASLETSRSCPIR